MDSDGAIESPIKKEHAHGKLPTPAQAVSHALWHSNGYTPNGVLPNGVSNEDRSTPVSNGETANSQLAIAGPSSPPLLDQTWRKQDNYKSLGLVMTRTAEQCYVDLHQVLAAMAETPADPPPPQTNGVAPRAQDTSSGSLKRKRLIMDFAHDQRDRFIKTLVLLDWSRDAEDKARLIDLFVWHNEQRLALEGAARAVGQTKLNMIGAKMPNPNLEGAMEILATGKADWVPHLGYIVPKKLSAKQLLKTLRNMNVALATRLVLHEELPRHFQEYSIADGRATFTVSGEFEVDLSIADEDPTTPFYFIDIRLLFKPASTISEQARSFLEGRVNAKLAKDGLQGCYAFLHNFVLTHKMTILRDQAVELIRGKWFGCIRIDSPRRHLALQYWTGMPGPKNWIEIGISSGKQEMRYKSPANPILSVRWFRAGIGVRDKVFDFDWHHLSTERFLSLVIAEHIAWNMRATYQKLQILKTADSPLEVQLMDSELGPETQISLSSPSLRRPVQVDVDPITGRSSIAPPSYASSHTERRIDDEPSSDVAERIAKLLCILAQESIRSQAQILDWAQINNFTRSEALHRMFGTGVLAMAVFHPKASWGPSLALAVTSSLQGEKWWAVSIVVMRDEQLNLVGCRITSARAVDMANNRAQRFTHDVLSRVEEAAVAEITLSDLAKQMGDLRIDHSFQKLATVANAKARLAHSTAPPVGLFFRFSQLLNQKAGKAGKSWALEQVRLTHHGLVSKAKGSTWHRGKVRNDLRMTLRPEKLAHLRAHVKRSGGNDIAINATDGLALQLLVPFGEPSVDYMRKRLHSLARLDRYLATLVHLNLPCSHASLSQLDFIYDSASNLSAHLTFSEQGDSLVKLDLRPPTQNPHIRIQTMLERDLNVTGDRDRFFGFAHILLFTLPLLRTLERLESLHLNPRLFSVHHWSSACYRLCYRSPLNNITFEIRAKVRNEGKKSTMLWHVQEVPSSSTSSASPSPELVQALETIFQEKGEHYFGLGNGFVAEAHGIGATLLRLDETVRRFSDSTAEAVKFIEEPSEGKAESPAVGKAEVPMKTEPPDRSNSSTSKVTPTRPIKPEPDVIMLD